MKNFYIYGAKLPYKWYWNWDLSHNTVNNNTFTNTYWSYLIETNQDLGHIQIYEGREGKFIIIGKAIDGYVDNGLQVIPNLTDNEKNVIKDVVVKFFTDLSEKEFNLYFVTNSE